MVEKPASAEPDPDEPSWPALLKELATQILGSAGLVFMLGGQWRWPAGCSVAIVGAVMVGVWFAIRKLGSREEAGE